MKDIAEAKQLLEQNGYFVAKWEDIEDAPKDGTKVLIFYPTTINKSVPGWVIRSEFDKGVGLWVFDEKSRLSGDYAPTHFMPIPNPPRDRDWETFINSGWIEN